MMNKYLKISRIIIIFGSGLIIFFFLSQDLVLSGKLEFKTDFKKFTPFISILKPQDRIEIKDLVYLKKEPVWFDIYLPRDFDKAVLEFIYKNDYNYKIEVGPKLYEENNPLQVLADGLDSENVLKTKILAFDLSKLPIRKGKLRFMISAPDLTDEQKGIYIKELKVKLIRKPIWQEGIIKNLTNYFNYYRNEFR